MGLRRTNAWVVPAAVLVLALTWSGRLAAGSADDTGGSSVRVYTNADLEPLGPAPEPPAPAADGEQPGWGFVTDFLDRQYERLDADRTHELERRRIETEEGAPDERPVESWVGTAPFFFGPWRHAERRRAPVPALGAAGPGNFIVPLHARPTPAQRMRAEAIRHSGADAVPRR